jgi:16S rRNA (uracil1498-N3)-methyltransferase
MSARRFFVEGVHRPGETVRIEGGDAHHIVHVLRLRPGDHVEVVDSAAHAFDAEIVDGDGVGALLVRESVPQGLGNVRIDVAQAMPKGQKMDYVVEKATELGAGAILPFVSERTVAREAGTAKLARWRRVARSASEQSGRRAIPAVPAPLEFDELLARFCAYDLVLFAWESSDAQPLRLRLRELLKDARNVLVVVGPEGGFSHAEADAARAAGAELISLGRNILRTETAALAMLAILNYETG